MKRALRIQAEEARVQTISQLTSTFESIASLRIRQTKDRVLSATRFFNDMWYIYAQLRVNPKERLTFPKRTGTPQKTAFLVITSEGGLSGDIDEQLVSQVVETYDTEKTDIIAVGAHGVAQLAQRQLPVAKQFPLPEVEETMAIGPIVEALNDYEETTIFYTQYQSLFSQHPAQIDLRTAVAELTEHERETIVAGSLVNRAEMISTRDYIFEPSLNEVIDFMESIMSEIAVTQVMLESRLAQFASRFQAMHNASRKAGEQTTALRRAYHSAQRAERDDRLKEIFNARRNG